MPRKQDMSLEEDWTGITDPAMRKRLQNRIHQRIYRRRRAKPSTATESNESNTESSRSDSLIRDSPNDRAAAQPKSIHTMTRGEIERLYLQYEASSRRDYMMGSPRVDQLLTLIQFNVFRALVDNTSTIGFTMDWLDEDSISPWVSASSQSTTTMAPASLHPTVLQRKIPHHPWIDLWPIPRMRDNILRTYDSDSFDEAALCNDLVDFYDVPNEQTGLIVWVTPWHPSGWEISETFLRKWSWVIQGCEELFQSTNYWRGVRGETAMVFEGWSTTG